MSKILATRGAMSIPRPSLYRLPQPAVLPRRGATSAVWAWASTKGDYVIVYDIKSGMAVGAFFADVGPAYSSARRRSPSPKALNIPPSPKNGGVDSLTRIAYVVFPGSFTQFQPDPIHRAPSSSKPAPVSYSTLGGRGRQRRGDAGKNAGGNQAEVRLVRRRTEQKKIWPRTFPNRVTAARILSFTITSPAPPNRRTSRPRPTGPDGHIPPRLRSPCPVYDLPASASALPTRSQRGPGAGRNKAQRLSRPFQRSSSACRFELGRAAAKRLCRPSGSAPGHSPSPRSRRNRPAPDPRQRPAAQPAWGGCQRPFPSPPRMPSTRARCRRCGVSRRRPSRSTKCSR